MRYGGQCPLYIYYNYCCGELEEMKMRLVAAVFAGLILGIFPASSILAQSIPDDNEGKTFFCGAYKGTPVTIYRSPRRDQSFLNFNYEYLSSSGGTPQRSCVEVSRRFQRAYENGTLKYISTGRLNGQPVVCTTKYEGGPCEDLLFTLYSADHEEKWEKILSHVSVLRDLLRHSNSTPAGVFNFNFDDDDDNNHYNYYYIRLVLEVQDIDKYEIDRDKDIAIYIPQGGEFVCDRAAPANADRNQDNLSTKFRTSTGAIVEIIRWSSEIEVNPHPISLIRCNEASSKLQEAYENGTLNYIKTQKVDEEPPIVCIHRNNDGLCDGIFFTLLEPDIDAEDFVEKLRRKLNSIYFN